MIGPVVDRPPPRGRAEARPSPFPDRRRAQGPQWASGVAVQAADTPVLERQMLPPRGLTEVMLPGERWEELTAANAAFDLLRAREVVWTLRLDVARTPLDDIAAGHHDETWAGLGRLVAREGTTTVIRILTPEGEARASAAAFRRAARAIRRTPGVVVEWSPPPGTAPSAAAALWPGEDVVDIVGVTTPRDAAWASEVAAPGGLADWSTWSREHRRRLAVHWSLDGQTGPDRVRRVADWLDVAARSGTLAYDTVATDEETRSEGLAAYRAMW